jgi:hypothetical protein
MGKTDNQYSLLALLEDPPQKGHCYYFGSSTFVGRCLNCTESVITKHDGKTYMVCFAFDNNYKQFNAMVARELEVSEESFKAYEAWRYFWAVKEPADLKNGNII